MISLDVIRNPYAIGKTDRSQCGRYSSADSSNFKITVLERISEGLGRKIIGNFKTNVQKLKHFRI